jgi:hypothetical protein
MTQAFNLSQFANTLNSSGQTSNSGLQNSSVTVTAGTGMSGGGAVALGSSVTLTNAGVTSIVAGTGISVSGATGAVTVTSTVTGGVSSLNGQTGAITNTTSNAIGSYTACVPLGANGSYSFGTTIAGSSLRSNSEYAFGGTYILFSPFNPSLSGTYRAMGKSLNSPAGCDGNYLMNPNLWVRIS